MLVHLGQSTDDEDRCKNSRIQLYFLTMVKTNIRNNYKNLKMLGIFKGNIH